MSHHENDSGTWRTACRMFFSWSRIKSRICPSSFPSRICDRRSSNRPSISLARSRTRGSTFVVRNKLTTVSREGGVEVVDLGLLVTASMLLKASKTCPVITSLHQLSHESITTVLNTTTGDAARLIRFEFQVGPFGGLCSCNRPRDPPPGIGVCALDTLGCS